MRGALYRVAANESWFRIIPADAGSTTCLGSAHGQEQDHPRGCGEHGTSGKDSGSRVGSSPRMRGALRFQIRNLPALGIIPADAGSTSSADPDDPYRWDHLRGCGEHLLDLIASVPSAGSSPRMRGAPSTYTPGSSMQGIIPADAGSTPTRTLSVSAPGDHPRGCGEHSFAQIKSLPTCGSSPRMRGALAT